MKVLLELHRLTDESASSSSHKRIVSQTKVQLELWRSVGLEVSRGGQATANGQRRSPR